MFCSTARYPVLLTVCLYSSWIKFEEDVEEGGNRWSKPHVGTISLHSLFELRSCILNGTVILDMEASSLDQIADLILENMVATKQLSSEISSKVKEALLRRHRHQHERRHDRNDSKNRLPIIRSLADIGRNSSKSMFGSHSKFGPTCSLASQSHSGRSFCSAPTIVVNSSSCDLVSLSPSGLVLLPFTLSYLLRQLLGLLRPLPSVSGPVFPFAPAAPTIHPNCTERVNLIVHFFSFCFIFCFSISISINPTCHCLFSPNPSVHFDRSPVHLLRCMLGSRSSIAYLVSMYRCTSCVLGPFVCGKLRVTETITTVCRCCKPHHAYEC